MGSSIEMENTKNDNKPRLKATPEVRMAFDELVSEENFIKSSEVIIKYFASLMSSTRDNEELPEDAKYVVKRLISSLASQRLLIRQGSYTIFQVTLQLYPQILSFAWSYIGKFYKENHKDKDLFADYAMGHALALGAIIRSGHAMGEASSVQDIIENLLSMAKSKFTVLPVFGQFLINLLSMYEDKNIAPIMWKVARDRLEVDMNSLPAPLLWLRIMIARDEYFKYLSDAPESFQRDTYDKSTFQEVFFLLKKLYAVGVNITPMVEDYFKSLVLYCSNDCSGENNLSLFFSTVVTPSLCSSESKENVFLFNISQIALSHLTSKKCIETVISSELLEILILACKSDNTEISASARGLLSAILQLIINKESGSKVQTTVMKRLMSTSLKLKFDTVTKTTVLQQATNNLCPESVISVTKFLMKNLENEISENKNFDVVVSTCHYINRALGLSGMSGFEHLSWKAEQVSYFFRLAFLNAFNIKRQQKLREFFLKSLNHSSNNIEWQASFVEEIVQRIFQLVKDGEFKNLSKDNINLFIDVSKNLNKFIEGKVSLSYSDAAVFKVLYGYGCLGIFIDSKDSEDLLNEIKQCYKNATKGNKKKKSLKGNKEINEKPEWREVVLDLLLSLITKEESFWRKIATIVFINICHSLKPSSLSLLTDIINPEKEDPILEEKTTNEDPSDEGFDNGIGIKDTSSNMEVDEDDTSDESDDDDSDEDKDDEGDEKDKLQLGYLFTKMQEIVGVEMQESVELDSVPQEELDNFDKQMSALIGNYIDLRNKLKKKKKLSKDETTLMCFRTRVCDLLETLIKEAPSLDHILEIMKPILLAINAQLEDKLQSHLLGRLRSLIVEISKVKKFVKPASVSSEEVASYLKDIFSMGNKFSNKMKVDIDYCCTFLVRSEQYLSTDDKNSSNAVMKAYINYLESKFNESSMEIYDGPLRLEIASLEMVLKLLLEIVFKDSRPFKKKKGVEMIKQILNNENALKKIPRENLKALLLYFEKETVKEFDSVKSTKQIQSNFLIMIIDVLRVLKKVFKLNSELEQLYEWDDVIQSVQNFHERIPLTDFKVLKNAIHNLANVISFELKSNNSEKSKLKKRKLGQTETGNEGSTTQKSEDDSVNTEMGESESGEKVELEENEDANKRKKRKKLKRNRERKNKNEARLWINYEVDDFSFLDSNLRVDP